MRREMKAAVEKVCAEKMCDALNHMADDFDAAQMPTAAAMCRAKVDALALVAGLTR